jgi:Family of unknown function (DUF6448)
MKSAHASPLGHVHNVGIMPPHCDSLDGPVVTAARRALDAGNVDVVLPFVPEQGEAEVKDVFQRTLRVRALDDEAREVADRLFFETVVRVHRAGEGAPYTGLKPAGLSFGPVIPLAETAVETGTAEPVSDSFSEELNRQLRHRLDEVNLLAAGKGRSVRDARRYVEAMLGFEVYCHRLFQAMQAPVHHGHSRAQGASVE